MLRLPVDLLDRTDLDHLSEVHHEDTVRDVADDVEVVGDEDVGQIELRLEVGEQIEHLRLDRFVERGHRLVENEKARVERERAGDVDALLLASGQFVRIALANRFGLRPTCSISDRLTSLAAFLTDALDLRAVGDRLLDR